MDWILSFSSARIKEEGLGANRDPFGIGTIFEAIRQTTLLYLLSRHRLHDVFGAYYFSRVK